MSKKRLSMVILFSFFVAVAQGDNLLTNGNFNTGDLTGWTVELVEAPGDVNAYVQTTTNYDGSPCLFMISRTNLWDGAAVMQVVDVNGLATVDFSCVANKWAWGDARVDLNWYTAPYDPCDPNANWLSWEEWDVVVDDGETDDWDSFSHTFTVPSTAVEVLFRLRANDWIWQVYYDDVFFGVPVKDQAILVAPSPGSSVPEQDKSNCGFGPTLDWDAAQDATGDHHIYFGTSYAEVNDANTSDPEYLGSVPLATTSYALDLNDVEKATGYFWRVDETVDGNVIKAKSIWQFSVSNLTWVDRFDNYLSDANIQAVWGPNASETDWTLQIVNYSSTKYEVGADACDLLCTADISDNALLVLLIHGHDNMSDDIYVKLESNNGAQSGIVAYPDPNALNQQSYEPFITWEIALQQFVSQGVDLTNVTGISIGVGSVGGPSGTGTISIDDVRLDYPYCIAELIPEDFDDNCWVGTQELSLLVDNWLSESYSVTASGSEPSPGPILWYKLDEGGSNDPCDYSGNGYHGFISNFSAWSTGTGINGSNCVNLNDSYRIEIPIAVNNDHNTIGAESTVSWWMKDPGQTEDTETGNADSMTLQIGSSDYGRSLEVWSGATGSFYYKAGYDSGTGYTDELNIGSMDYTNPDHPQDQWVHYAFVKSYSNGYVRAYRNGELIAEGPAAVSGTPILDGVDSFATLGAWRWTEGFGGYCDGLIDDFRIYDYPLSHEDVLYLAVQGGSASSPLTQGLLTPSDATDDDLVNLSDLAEVAESWLQQVVFP